MLPTSASHATHAAARLLAGALNGRVLRCVVCDATVRPVAGIANQYPTCHAIACRMVISRRSEMTDTAFRYFLQRQGEQKRALAVLAAAASARSTSEAAENAQVWAQLAAFARQPAAPLQLVIPSGPVRGRPLKVARKLRYLAHVRAMADQAAALPPGAPVNNDDVDTADTGASSARPGRLCGYCGGGCCTLGSDHAYLSPPTLRRFMDAQPQLSIADVVAAYVERMPAAPRFASCINHTSIGCSLPRAMRSDICNNFACGALKQLQGAPMEQVVLVVRRTQDLWRRDRPDRDNAVNGAAVLRDTGVRRMQYKPSGPA
jgi:hypothetical protein